MPRLLTEAELDPVSEQVDATLTAEEEKGIPWLNPDKGAAHGDLSTGGSVNGVKVTPYSGWGGTPLERGRPVGRRAWDVFGTESVLALKWNPDGDVHDGARSYLQKRHCTCCHFGGFRLGPKLRGCPQCIKNNCARCVGGTVRANIIPQFYLRETDVPFPVKRYGSVDCFLPLCPRREGVGFKTQEEMILHARAKHRGEWEAHLQVAALGRVEEVTSMREELAFMRRRMEQLQAPQPQAVAVAEQPAPRGMTPREAALKGWEKRRARQST